ncbi:hypothetical protein [Salibacterium aidingense]|uniref:hypothetical protein n=1 Tax=Salibacterium aidingense TaxID=384933 RepID=UPI00047B0B64|nr:hypothetical protein [Salibacterium aidingense]
MENNEASWNKKKVFRYDLQPEYIATLFIISVIGLLTGICLSLVYPFPIIHAEALEQHFLLLPIHTVPDGILTMITIPVYGLALIFLFFMPIDRLFKHKNISKHFLIPAAKDMLGIIGIIGAAIITLILLQLFSVKIVQLLFSQIQLEESTILKFPFAIALTILSFQFLFRRFSGTTNKRK